MNEEDEGEEVSAGSEFVRWFSRLDQSMVSVAGFKGASLGELYKNRFPVPNGFAVTSLTYENFISSSKIDEKISLLLNGINPENNELVINASEKIKELIIGTEFSEDVKEEIIDSYQVLGSNKVEIEKGNARDILDHATEPIFVSVRSSLCFKSERGEKMREQDTYLNVKGNDSLLEHIKRAFASLFNPDTLKRELKKGEGISKLKIAVIVEKMIDSEKSGIVFSEDSLINIYSIWGVGEGLSIKNIFPDRQILSRELEIIDKSIGEKNYFVARGSSGSLRTSKSSDERRNSQVLNNYEIQRLGDLYEKIEDHFGNPQRVEFGIDESGIYILQSEDYFESSSGGKIEIVKEKIKEELLSVEKVENVTKTKLKLVLDSPYLLNEVKKSSLKKVGVLKIEKIIEKKEKHPFYFLESNFINEYENLIFNGISPIAENFEEVYVRTSDFFSDEFVNLEGGKKFIEKNPLLGLHGIRFGLKYPDILEAELRAIMRIREKTDAGILIPNIISVDELRKVKGILKKINFENPKIGVIIETPASIQLIKEFCEEGVDSVVVHADRLLEYLLAIDRKNKSVIGFFDELNPSFLYQLEYLIRVAKRNNVETNVFGDSLLNDEVLKFLVKRGIEFASVPPQNAKKISEKIHSFESELFHGTDLEPRNYELQKEKGEYLGKKSQKENKDPLGIL